MKDNWSEFRRDYVKLTTNIPIEIHKRLKTDAAIKQVNMRDIILMLLTEYLKKNPVES